MNATLEAMAQALFKSWFVDFDPVKAKAAGRAPEGMDADTAALFPGEFVESELGSIPKGWAAGQVSDLGHVICGKTPSTKEPENFGSEIPFITIPDMHGKVFVCETARALSLSGATSQQKKMLPANSVCVSCIATTGLVALTSVTSQTNQQINSIVPNNNFGSYFCYGILERLGSEIGNRGSGGSVFSNLNTGDFSRMRVLLPTIEVAASYNALVAPLFDTILQNEQQSKTLTQIRDTLLPKLISGQLRIPEAEAMAEAAL